MLLLVLLFPCLILIFFCRYELVSNLKDKDDDIAVNGERISEKPIIQVKRDVFSLKFDSEYTVRLTRTNTDLVTV